MNPENVLNVPCSAVPHAFGTEPVTVNLLQCLAAPDYLLQFFPPGYIPRQEQIRMTADKSRRDELKKRMPALLPCGIFEGGRKKQHLHKHSNLIAIDFDEDHNSHYLDFEELKTALCNIENVAYCGRSVSGRGFWVLIPIAHPEKHEQHFTALEQAFLSLMMVADPSCSDVSRLRYYSFDREAYFNPNAKPFLSHYSPPPPEWKKYPSGGFSGQDGAAWQRYNDSEDFSDLLLSAGWSVCWQSAEKIRFTRPGKSAGVSAEFDRVKKVFFVFSSNAEPFEAKGYSPFAVYTILQHGGDYKAAAKSLQAEADFSTINPKP
jgi:hypothetical protein